MKTNLIIGLLLLSTWSSFAQDTSFIFKNTANGVYHAIFIEQKPDSKYYDWIADLNFKQLEQKNYSTSIKSLKGKNSKPLAKYDLGDLPRRWCLLYRYNGQFYLYSPSDYMGNENVAITDSTYNICYSDGPLTNRIIAFAKPNAATYQFKLSGYNNTQKTIRIHMVDKKRGIAVFENPAAEPKQRYRFMVQADKAKNFPMIINYCKTQKQLEFEGFDKVDFAKWIGKK
ncbi:MAG: hypothetical protein SFV55_06855 [Haliscomenobacter sp.]|uniref:hypothetical protein n=1 Tax=Haliscomenobacter sp. TaxID=2717303 RepID=UPI0029AC93DB|nr:hypothetical protein [Haliscomenobacter sp.]MDX2068128.1 hypothetical protein [Haliscomenobacter sp.]